VLLKERHTECACYYLRCAVDVEDEW